MRVLFIIAPQKFRDEEYFHPKEELEKAKVKVVTASKAHDIATGLLGAKVSPDIVLSSVKLVDYQAIAFIGGGGSMVYFNDPVALDLAKKFYNDGKVVGAICIAPAILANAGLLKGRKATASSSVAENLKAAGANYTGEPVTVDGRLITASGPSAAREFGKAIAKAIGAA